MSEDALIRKANLRLLGKSPAELKRLLGNSPSYWRDLLEVPSKSFGEKAARSIEDRWPLPRGWLDVPHEPGEAIPPPRGPDLPSVAQELSFEAFTLPPSIPWEEVEGTQLDKLPEKFVTTMPDDSLAGHIEKGTGLIFERGLTPSPGKTVLIQDSEGQRFVRRYTQVRGDHWQAHASVGYAPLDSKEHGLKVIATLKWRES